MTAQARCSQVNINKHWAFFRVTRLKVLRKIKVVLTLTLVCKILWCGHLFESYRAKHSYGAICFVVFANPYFSPIIDSGVNKLKKLPPAGIPVNAAFYSSWMTAGSQLFIVQRLLTGDKLQQWENYRLYLLCPERILHFDPPINADAKNQNRASGNCPEIQSFEFAASCCLEMVNTLWGSEVRVYCFNLCDFRKDVLYICS